MSAQILAGEEGISASVEILRRGGVVGLPTETVYGLAADAFQSLAVAGIFEAKGRPLTDPIIVHLPEAGWLDRVALFTSSEQRQLIETLASAFWPGPLTLLLTKHPDLSDLVTAGSDRVAVRVTSHPLFREVLRRLDSPLAAPSANRFGRISPTSVADVRIELGDVIPLILDGGPCEHGMESTLVAVEVNGGDSSMSILRPGPITKDQLIQYGHVVLPDRIVNSPGSLPGHYAPEKRLQIINSDINEFIHNFQNECGYLAFTPPPQEIIKRCAVVEILSPTGNLKEAAVNFYGALRRLDMSKADIIYAESLPEQGIGTAIMDRLRRASHGSLHGTGHQSVDTSVK
ncbi:MAG: threonylcarbamoyl-AMP synthase [Verrucomicrobia bacterium]|nr:threonylcarbamoyl-AMP synthase [Verrucomicrobiota bacterium]